MVEVVVVVLVVNSDAMIPGGRKEKGWNATYCIIVL